MLASIITNDILCDAYFTKPYVSTFVLNSLDNPSAAYANAREQCPKEGTRQEDYCHQVNRMYKALVAIQYTIEARKGLNYLMKQVTDQELKLSISDIESKCNELLDELMHQ